MWNLWKGFLLSKHAEGKREAFAFPQLRQSPQRINSRLHSQIGRQYILELHFSLRDSFLLSVDLAEIEWLNGQENKSETER